MRLGVEMAAVDLPRPSARVSNTFRVLLLAVCALSFTVAMVGVAVTPLLIGHLYAAGGDYSRISNIGQVYSAASAVIVVMALGIVAAGLTLQYRQFAAGRLQALSDSEDQLIRLAMQDPHYRQCWGARVAPEDVDEADYYYCNAILKNLKRAWQLHDLSEAQARAYLASLFDSEIGRTFWHDNGDWHQRVKTRGRRARIVEIINEAYLHAEKCGPPGRPYEPRRPVRAAARSRRQEVLNTDLAKGRTVAP
jgi:hypothetical protein